MACRLFGAKPLPEPMLAYCHLDSWEQISVKFESEFNHIIFIQENAFENVICQNGGYFVKGGRWFNTLRPRQNGRQFADAIFKGIFLNENVRISMKISLKFIS